MGAGSGPSPDAALPLGFGWRGLDLAGALHHPAGSSPFPTIVMMQGSGPMERDNDGYFVPIRDAFVEAGLAVYSFDKPGCGESTGDWHDHALFDRVDQVAAALGALRADPRVDADRVGVFGHSQGGWMAQILAARHELDLAFAVASSGPSIGVPAQDRYAIGQRLRLDGHAESAVAEALAAVERLQAAAAAGANHRAVITDVLNPLHDRPWFDLLAFEEPEWRLTTRFLREGYDPTDALRQVGCPFLAVYGGRDVLLPALESASDCGRLLADAPCRDSTVIVFPDGDHRLRDEGGTFVPGYLDLLATWVAGRARSRDARRR